MTAAGREGTIEAITRLLQAIYVAGGMDIRSELCIRSAGDRPVSDWDVT